MVERLLITPEEMHPGKFLAILESTGEVVVRGSKQPIVDGARALLGKGLDPLTRLTSRCTESPHDSFLPAPCGEWAKWAYTEGEKQSLRRYLWMPRPAAWSGRQEASSEEAVRP